MGKVINLKRCARSLLDSLGLEVVRKKPGVKYGAMPGYHRLDRLPDIKTVIDIGVGHQGSPFLYGRWQDPFFFCIDPLSEASEVLENSLESQNYHFIQCAVGSERKTGVVLHVSSVPSRTSLFERSRNNQASAPSEKRVTNVERLDDLIAANTILRPALLKIDIEGGELDCLAGAQSVIEEVDFIILELPLTDNYVQGYRFSDVIGFLAAYELEPLMVLKAGNNNVDLLFCRLSDPLRRDLSYGC